LTERRFRELLAARAADCKVPGASAAIFCDGKVLTAATGVLNVETGVAVTPDSIFQIGSITKVMTATLVMQLAQAHDLDLHDPVLRYLPDLRRNASVAWEGVTIRQLLAHSSGIDGDFIIDCGPGPDAVTRYVGRCSELDRLFNPGGGVSYCTAGYVVLGRITEIVARSTWEVLFLNRIASPLARSSLLSHPKEVSQFQIAVGHVCDETGRYRIPRRTQLPAALAPAGSTVAATASDLVAFALAHLGDERIRESTGLLYPDTAISMRDAAASLPAPQWYQHHRGLGWALFDWDGHRIFGHDGGTIGQSSSLRVSPQHSLVVALLANGGDARRFHDLLSREILMDLAGLKAPAPPPDIELCTERRGRLTGTYQTATTRIDVLDSVDGLYMRTTTMTSPGEPITTSENIVAVSEYACRTTARDGRTPEAIVFHGGDEVGRPRFLTVRTRTHRRVTPEKSIATYDKSPH